MLVFEFVSDSAFHLEDRLECVDFLQFVLRFLRYLESHTPPVNGHYTAQSHCRAPGVSMYYDYWVNSNFTFSVNVIIILIVAPVLHP